MFSCHEVGCAVLAFSTATAGDTLELPRGASRVRRWNVRFLGSVSPPSRGRPCANCDRGTLTVRSITQHRTSPHALMFRIWPVSQIPLVAPTIRHQVPQSTRAVASTRIRVSVHHAVSPACTTRRCSHRGRQRFLGRKQKAPAVAPHTELKALTT